MIGQLVGQYRITEKLGEGGMGAVYKGVDTMIEREVAIKVLKPEIAEQPALVERFRSEAVTLAKLNSPAIATLYNFFLADGKYFMVMEFVPGRTLDAVLRESGPMQPEKAVSMFRQILEGIQPAHNAGILHRDIKPSNIIVTPWGGVKVMDFGIARVLGASRLTREGTMVGTLEYIAPERVMGAESDVRADIYSLGILLYEMLSGRLPFQSTTEFEIMRGHVQEAPIPLTHHVAGVPAVLEAAVMKALAKSPAARHRDCAAFLAALQGESNFAELPATVAVDLPVLPPVPHTIQLPPPPPKSNAKLYAAVGGGVAAVALAGILVFNGANKPTAPVTPEPKVAAANPSLPKPSPAAPLPAPPQAKPTPSAPAVPAPTPVTPAASPEPPKPAEVALEPGLYVKHDATHTAIAAEPVTWKKSVGTIAGSASPNILKAPVTLLFSLPAGASVTDYQLILARPRKGARELKANLLSFSAKKLEGRIYQIEFTHGPGEYALTLPPADPPPPTAYTFRVE